ncbi:protease complex subunit PrcB family protein [Actinoplanes sp. NPDC049599]|uniref:protease complex subunit PrcB family protein n=1 Tax=Actinoplanes sp. NPDC049599 TaxID=3363903 RepID=UPI0037B97AA2
MVDSESSVLPFRTLFRGSAVRQTLNGLFVADEAGLVEGFWLAATGVFPVLPGQPEMDLTVETMVVLTLGRRPVLGYSVSIDRLQLRGDTLIVEATERRPGRSGLDQIESPAHLVAVRKRGLRNQDMDLRLRIVPAI